MDKKTECFIERANIVHNNKFDYSNSTYISAHSKISIICPIHGEFFQVAYSHLKGHGCKACSEYHRQQTNLKKYGGHPMQHELVKKKRKQTNIIRYGVEHTLQNDTIKKKQEQTMLERYNVINPSQCPTCVDKKQQTNLDNFGVNNPFKSNDIKLKIQQTNLDRYGGHPTKSNSVKQKKKQTNLDRYGVEHVSQSPVIQRKMVTTTINRYGVEYYGYIKILNCLSLLEDRDWLFNQYIIEDKSAIQIADELNISDTTIGRYLRKHNIQIKQNYQQSHLAIKWLDLIMESEGIFIQHASNIGEYQIPGTRYKADGYCKETHTIYEFYGDYWHGNPEIYDSDLINESVGCTMSALYQNTIKREQQLIKLGYTLVVMWENKWKQIYKELIDGSKNKYGFY